MERGTLESAKNSDIICNVKKVAGNTLNVKWVIDDGSDVKKGDLLLVLDDSAHQDQLKAQKIVVDQAEGNKIEAEEQYKITLSQNESEINTATVDLELKRIDLQKYQEGDFPQKLKDVLGRIKQFESDVDQQRDRAAWAQRMVKKTYMTAVQAQAELSRLQSLELNLAKVREEMRVLTDPLFGERKRQETDLRNKVAEAERALERVKSQAKAKEVQAKAKRATTRSVYQQELDRFRSTQAEIAKCRITAPQDGLVVYFVPEQARFGSGAQQSIVAQGEPVREGQKLMQIPDLRQMRVNTKVHEALVSHVHAGQPASISVDSFPDRKLHGYVEAVATVSSQQDFLSADVKVYATKVMIDEAVPGLKPGMSAKVAITIGDALEHVLTIPVQAIVGSADLGKHRQCVVVTPTGTEERNIIVGMSNDKMAEIKEGLQEGDRVVLNPRAVLGDKIKTGAPGKDKNDSGNAGEKGKKTPGKRAPAKNGPDDRQKALLEKFRSATPEQRKQMLQQIPEEFREKAKAMLQQQGLKVE